jgi:hypothetical protein
LRSLLAQNDIQTQVVEPQPWERFEVNLSQPSIAVFS